MKAVVATFDQEKALVGAFSVITNLRIELFEALVVIVPKQRPRWVLSPSSSHRHHLTTAMIARGSLWDQNNSDLKAN